MHSKEDALAIALACRHLLPVANAYVWSHVTLRDDETTHQRILFLNSHHHLLTYIVHLTIEWPAHNILEIWKSLIWETAVSIRAVACVAMHICPETIHVICPILPPTSILTFIGCVIAPNSLMFMIQALTQPASVQLVLSLLDVEPFTPPHDFTSMHHLGVFACDGSFWTSDLGDLLQQLPLSSLVYAPAPTAVIAIGFRWRTSLTKLVINLQNYTADQLTDLDLPSFESLRFLRLRCDHDTIRDIASITGRVGTISVLDIESYVYEADCDLWQYALSCWASIPMLHISLDVCNFAFRYSPPVVNPLRVFLTQTVRRLRPHPAVTHMIVQRGILPRFHV
ncbi:hypothetical protein BDZ89DRAFT_1129841 [Hymenopellis radicata]|nr:hypothetical protein BDZ89DRAFT_1129841 [Hymenopellis radicata]